MIAQKKISKINQEIRPLLQEYNELYGESDSGMKFAAHWGKKAGLSYGKHAIKDDDFFGSLLAGIIYIASEALGNVGKSKEQITFESNIKQKLEKIEQQKEFVKYHLLFSFVFSLWLLCI